MRRLSFYYFIPVILWAILIFILLTLPEDDFSGSSLAIIPNFDKIVHAGLFGAMVFWWTLPFAKRVLPSSSKLIWIAVYCSLFGIAMEFVQKYFTTDRAFDYTDMLADTIGAFLSYFVMRYIFLKVQTKKQSIV